MAGAEEECWRWRARRRWPMQNHSNALTTTHAPTATPAPMPAFVPVESPELEVVADIGVASIPFGPVRTAV